jgi:mono/diheme cytochrome c family protein
MLNCDNQAMPSARGKRGCVLKSDLRIGIMLFLAATQVAACSMSEEVKRIEAVRRAELRHEAASSTNLSGEQIFIRSCNTCHPGGGKGIGPTLAKVNEHFGEDNALKALLRKGKGTMPAQSKAVLNDEEMNNLVAYLRTLPSQLAADKR